jgi:hypothetical protein
MRNVIALKTKGVSTKGTDFRFSGWLIIGVNAVLELLCRVVVGDTADV